MIRINLLPVKQARRREAARNHIIIGVLILLLEVVVLGVWHMNTSNILEEQRNKNKAVQRSVEKLQSEIFDHQQILDDIAEFEKKQEAIDDLQKARTGPVFVMLELARILSQDGKPTLNNESYQEMLQIDPDSGYDPQWDFRKVWITSYIEKNRKVKLNGQALTHEDVAEFLRRLKLSDFFKDSNLISTALLDPSVIISGFDAKKADPDVHFRIETVVSYR